jgi:hypothetical protein
MGEFGNFLTFTTKDIDTKVSKALPTINNQVQETTEILNNVHQQIQTFSSTYEHSFNKAAAQLHTIIDKFSYFQGTQDQYMQTYGTRCSQTRTYHETSLTTFGKNLNVKIQTNMENDIKTHIQHVIETNLQPTYNQHLEELDTTVSSAILNIELLQQDCIEALQDITQSQQSTFHRSSTNSSPTTELPPPHWQNHPTPSPTKSTYSKMPGRVNWGVPISQTNDPEPTKRNYPYPHWHTDKPFHTTPQHSWISHPPPHTDTNYHNYRHP